MATTTKIAIDTTNGNRMASGGLGVVFRVVASEFEKKVEGYVAAVVELWVIAVVLIVVVVAEVVVEVVVEVVAEVLVEVSVKKVVKGVVVESNEAVNDMYVKFRVAPLWQTLSSLT